MRSRKKDRLELVALIAGGIDGYCHELCENLADPTEKELEEIQKRINWLTEEMRYFYGESGK